MSIDFCDVVPRPKRARSLFGLDIRLCHGARCLCADCQFRAGLNCASFSAGLELFVGLGVLCFVCRSSRALNWSGMSGVISISLNLFRIAYLNIILSSV